MPPTSILPLPPSSSTRSCTDFICLILFLLFTMGLGLAGVYASTRENDIKTTCQLDKVCSSMQFIYDGVHTVKQQWRIIFTGIGICLFTSVLMLLFLRLTSPFLIYFLLTLTFFSLFFMSIYLMVPLPSVYIFKSSQILSISFGVVFMLMAIGLVIGACCFKRRIALAGSVIEVAGDVARKNNVVLLLPLIISLSIIVYIAMWSLLLQSMSYFKLFSYLLPPILLIFHLIWSILFILHTSTFLISGTAINCYYSLQSPYSTSVSNYLQFHAGSVVMGSFMNVLFAVPKLVFQVFTEGEGGCCGGFFRKCCGYMCCVCSSFAFDCINSTSYAFIHLTGESYCFSSLTGLQLQQSLPLPTFLLYLLLSIFSIAVPLIISILCFVVTYVLHDNFIKLPTQTVALLIVTMISVGYCISRATIGVIGDSINGVFVCFMREIASGQRKEGYSPQELREWMRQSAKEGHEHIVQ